MDAQTVAATVAPTAAVSAARLLIRKPGHAATAGWRIDSLWQRVRSHGDQNPRPAEEMLALEIRDLQGSMVLALKDAGALTDLSLPPGTYHVTAQLGNLRRGYTVTLAQGTSFDLHLQLTRNGHR